jgi:hypothetical protein
MKEKILEILTHYFDWHQSYLAVPDNSTEYEIQELPGLIFMRINHNKNLVYIINDLYLNPAQQITTHTSSITDFDKFPIDDLTGIEQCFGKVKMALKTIQNQKELNKIKQDF